ncbi:tRNA guanosine(15) transglycosylase TgtA [Sulfolobus sp. A20]|uniref:tRNA guanosine(15) transglycosylase TgtA n=1 Tax=Sulfolobaceae TaxID=118883 RepID=UPI000845EBAA|nr:MULTISPECIES: tRNA guanosine(15) transglycosylase TgtA [unclassified Sulfolobus]TRM76557.1 tRNA guanosine(15) transglycosylase TgtA [Sulfolobus sp. B5]TRM77773.1 tRNA guanosine(15) transglycosylase TgtA [Sulfolobus sp. A20-N-F8]TRM81434.1 tRNA guanosine(15) transglycosylase TgtA [Sulfolobus sp. D5]TRM83916.1 tRNA guanosine(15) transglycosylase TgtA [Sulfolobus sp. A20-N-F6]TRM88713.1 tRNA guanosine(15) transglycosylase TgtA [Sulfolobus sp. C3]TRM94760.1 tRNA guanosine(15) transglycosylase 
MTIFEVRYQDLAARIGIIQTPHGNLETPAFFPVINILKDEIKIEDIKKVGFSNFITNAFILYKNKLLQNNIHRELNAEDMIIMTDSGAYQILEYGDININNEEIINYELKIKPDIAVILDLPTGNTENYENAKTTVIETIERAKEAEKFIKDSDIIWVYPIQGGRFLDLVHYSASQLNNFENIYKVTALGSPTVLLEKYRYDIIIDMIYIAKSAISRNVPFHLFGGGLPHIIPLAVALGVDMFDSASYIIYARDGRYMTRSRVHRLEELDYFPCSCPICSRYTPRELMSMDKKERIRLLALHNLYVIKEEINATKQAIKEGRLFEYLQEKAFSHTATYNAFKRLLKYKEYLEKYDPRIRGDTKGIFLFNEDSLSRPEILRHKRYLTRYKKKFEKITIICYDGNDTFYDFKEKILKEYYNNIISQDIFIAVPFFGLIPLRISDTFPFSQSEIPIEVNEEVIRDMKNQIINFLVNHKYSNVEFINCKKLNLHINPISTSPT